VNVSPVSHKPASRNLANNKLMNRNRVNHNLVKAQCHRVRDNVEDKGSRRMVSRSSRVSRANPASKVNQGSRERRAVPGARAIRQAAWEAVESLTKPASLLWHRLVVAISSTGQTGCATSKKWSTTQSYGPRPLGFAMRRGQFAWK
jgi:hypothetical protein